jgi:addiction module HigA family antidote
MLLEEFLKPLGLSVDEVAKRLRMRRERLQEIINEKRGVTADTALRLERLLGMEAQFWLKMQLGWDLYHAKRSAGAAIRRIHRLPALRRAS